MIYEPLAPRKVPDALMTDKGKPSCDLPGRPAEHEYPFNQYDASRECWKQSALASYARWRALRDAVKARERVVETAKAAS